MENSPPLLLISHGEFHEKQLVYNVLENSFRVLNNNPILCCKYIMASCHGWLVLANPWTNECCLWNPISTDVIKLPNLKLASIYRICVLSKPPTEPDCHILFNTASTLEQSFCRIGDEEFCHVEERDEDGNLRQLRAVASFQGRIYGFMDPGNLLVTIDFAGKNLEFKPMMIVDEPWRIPELSTQFSRPYDNMWFIESQPRSCGGDDVELLLVRKVFSCRYVTDALIFKVFQVDTDRKTCVELDDIGQRAIFVSHFGGGFCCRSSSKIKPNSIYYTDHYGRYLYIYELEDSSTTSLLPSNLADCNSVSCWVEPRVFA